MDRFRMRGEELAVAVSRSDTPPGRGGREDEPTEEWRASPFVGSRLPAKAHAPGIIDIVILVLNKQLVKTDHKQLGRN